MSEHPSTFELDLYHLTRQAPPALHAHLERCEVCTHHLRALQEPAPLPGWAAALPPQAPRQRWRSWLVPLGTVALAALALFVVVLPGQLQAPDATVFPAGPEPAYAPKGAPQAQVQVRRGTRTWQLEAGEALRGGDAIRLSLRPAGLSHFFVFSLGAKGPVLLSQGVLPPEGGVAPGAWEVEGSEGEEHLRVVFSRDPLSESDAREAARLLHRGEDVWTVELRLKKEAGL